MKSLPAVRPPASNREDRKSDASWRRVAVAGYVLIFVTFGVVGGWAAVAKIDRAVAAPGVVAIESNRKTVQHLEGGIVREILVKEGDAVSQGAILFRLENVQAKANYQTIESQLYTLLAMEARLIAERDQKAEITWPEELVTPNSDGAFDSHIAADQVAEFNKRGSSLQDQVEMLKSRIDQLDDEIRGTQMEKASAEGQIDFINKELIGLRELNEKKLIPATRLYAMERERERLEGAIGEAIANIAKSNGAIGEYNIQIQQLREKFQEDVAKSLVEVREKLADVRQKLVVAKDVLHRVEVVAPVAGTVQNLKVFTIGQVIRQGEPLLDIVPKNERLIIEVQFSPSDIDGVYEGQEAEVRFPAFHSRMIPLILGQLESVSRDRLVDEASKQPYYRGIVVLDNTEIPEELRSRVRAGMPAEVIVASGERTVLSYIVSPLTQTLRKGFIN
jgi:HlyD family secretion protein